MTNLTIDCRSLELTDEQFYQLCINNPNVRFERNSKGDLLIMSPVGDISSNRNARLTQQLLNWSDRQNTGIVFDSSAGFILSNGATRSPDVSWIPLEKWNQIPAEEKERFSHICPDFVIELMSPSDNLKDMREKMKEYIDNGTILAWLINPKRKQVEIYRPHKDIRVLNHPQTLSGEDVLKDFVLNLERIW